MGKPSIYPTGVTIYDRERAFNGYTLFNSVYGATLIDMNGRLVKVWKGISEPLKPLPGGNVIGSSGLIPGPPGAASKRRLVQADWEGHVVWRFCDNKMIKSEEGEYMASCHHHDYRSSEFKEIFPGTGRYAPCSGQCDAGY